MITEFDMYKKYWGIQIRKDKNSKRILPYLEVPLEKLGMSDSEIEHWKKIFSFSIEDHVYLYLNNRNEWKYGRTIDKIEQNGYGDYEYGGEITFDKEDKEFYKLKKDAKKYNL